LAVEVVEAQVELELEEQAAAAVEAVMTVADLGLVVLVLLGRAMLVVPQTK
jgi:hypothetical protein